LFESKIRTRHKRFSKIIVLKICQRLGWKGKGTRFDVLPLVLQANGEDPDLYEIPEDLILEVNIRHPE